MEQFTTHIVFELLSTLVASSVFVVLLFDRKEGPIRLSFLAMIFSMMIWQSTKLYTNASIIYGYDLDVEFWRRVSFWFISLVPPTTFLMSSFLSRRFNTWIKYPILLAFVLMIGFMVIEPLGLIFKGHQITSYGYYHIPGDWYYVWMAVYSIIISAGLYLLFPSHYKRFPDFQRQSIFIFSAAGFGFAVGALEFYSVLVGPIYPVADLAPCIFGGLLYWTIFRYNFLGGWGVFKIVAMRLMFFAAIYLVVYLVFNLGIWVQHATGLPSGNSIFVFCAALVATLMMPIYITLVKNIRRKFYPIRFGYRTIFLNLLQKLTQHQSLDEMVRIALEELEYHFQYENGYGILFETNGLDIKSNQWRIIESPQKPPQIKPHLFERSLEKIVNRHHLLQGLRFSRTLEQDRGQFLRDYKFIQRLDADLVVPINSNGKCYGLLVLKERHYKAESWEVAEQLLNSISEILGGQIAQMSLLEHQSRQDRLSQVGMMAAGMAHEIKNPLEGIYGAAQLLEEEALDSDPTEEIVKESSQVVSPMINIILKESRRLNDLVHQFLTFSRPFRLSKEKSFVGLWLQEFIDDQKTLGIDLDLIISSKTLGTENHTDVDLRGLHQILLNLVQNAARYQLPGKQPRILWDPIERIIQVQDDGPGVPIEEQSKIFNPFYTTSNKGTGLGLAISNKIASEMGGDLHYQTLEPGSSFILELGEHPK